jgi:putative inorganic carbon (HCO3(-)) transporter
LSTFFLLQDVKSPQYQNFELAAANSKAAFLIPLLAVTTLLAGLYAPAVLAILLVLLALLFSVNDPFRILVLVAFLIPFNFVFVIGEIPVAAELLKVFMWGPFVLYLFTKKQKFRFSRYSLPFLAIFVLLAYSCLVATNLPFVVKESVRMGSSISLCYVAVNLIDTREKLFVVLKSIGISSLIVAIYGLYQFAIQDFGALFWLVNPRITTSLAPSRAVFYEWRNRITSVLTGEMEAAVYFNYCIPVAGALFLYAKNRSGRIFWMSTFILLLVGLLLTFTFGAWAAFAASLVYLGWKFRDRLPAKAIVLTPGLIMLAAAGVIAANIDVMTHRIELVAFDMWTRWEFWRLALGEFLTHPIVGGGLGSFGPMVSAANFDWLERISPEWSATMSPHNAYMYILSQFGLVGFLCIWGVLIHAIRSMVKIAREVDQEFRWIGLGLALSLSTVVVGSLTDDGTIFGPHSSPLIWLLVALTEVAVRLAGAHSGRVAFSIDER